MVEILELYNSGFGAKLNRLGFGVGVFRVDATGGMAENSNWRWLGDPEAGLTAGAIQIAAKNQEKSVA